MYREVYGNPVLPSWYGDRLAIYNSSGPNISVLPVPTHFYCFKKKFKNSTFFIVFNLELGNVKQMQ